MDKVLTKPNDIFVATVSAPDATLLDFLSNNLNADNTSLLSKEDYLKTPFVKKKFTDLNGIFNNEQFEAYYSKAQENYNNLDDKLALEGLNDYLEYNSNSRYRDFSKKTRDMSYSMDRIKNPLLQEYGLEGFNVVSDPEKTEKEVSLGHRIWDYDNKKWLEDTAEGLNIFKKLLGSTLVYATYDLEGVQENPVTGEVGFHYKGERITDEFGDYFTETLGNRLLLTKEVVSVLDILTKEDSILNKLDFYDSDGRDKSIGGIVMKSLVSILPYLTPLKGYYGAFTMAMLLANTMPILYKSLENVISGDTNSLVFLDAVALENWFAKWERSKSDKGRSGFFNLESIGELVVDTFGLLHLQRAAAKLAPKVLSLFDDDIARASKYNKLLLAGKYEEAAALQNLVDLKKLNTASSGFAFAYMGLQEGTNVYNDALNSGYDRTTAGIATLATVASLLGIMKFNEGKNGIGTWFLDKTTGYNLEVNKGAIGKLAKDNLKTLYKDIQTAVTNNDKRALSYTIRDWKAKSASKMHDWFVANTEDLWKGFIVEGVEEVTEEATQDMVKGVIDALSWLGYTPQQGSFGGVLNVFSREGLLRYLATGVGGGIGGSIFAALRKWIDPFTDSLFSGKAPSFEETLRFNNIVDVYAEGRFDDYIEALDKGKKFIKNSLDLTIIDLKLQQYGLTIAPGETLADLAVKIAKHEAYTIKNIIETTMPGISGRNSFEKRLLLSQWSNNQLFKGLEGFEKDYLYGEFKELAEEVARLKARLLQLDLASELSDELKSEKKDIEETLKTSIEKFNNFFNAENYSKYSIDAALSLNTDLIKNLVAVDLNSYSENIYGVPFYKITDESLKSKILDEWNSIKESLEKLDYKSMILTARDIYLNIYLKIYGKIFDLGQLTYNKELLKYIYSLNDDANKEDIIKLELLKIIENSEMTPEEKEQKLGEIYQLDFYGNLLSLIKAKPEFFSISSRYKFDLYNLLKSTGVISLDSGIEGNELNSDEEKLVSEIFNQIAARSSVDIWNLANLTRLIDYINTTLSSSNNIYGMRLDELRQKNIDENKEGLVTLSPVSIVFNADNYSKNSDKIRSSKVDSLFLFAKSVGDQGIDLELKEYLVKFYTLIAQDILIKNDLLNYIEDDNNILSEILNISSDEYGDDETTQQFRDAFSEEFLNLIRELLAAKPVENGIVTALKLLCLGITNGEVGTDIFDLISKINLTRSINRLFMKELSASLLKSVSNAIKSLNIIMNIIDASTESGTSSPTVISYAKNFLDLTGKNTSSINPLTPEVNLSLKGFIEDLKALLVLIINYESALYADKNKKDLENERLYNIALSLKLKTLTIKIDDKLIFSLPDDEKDLLETKSLETLCEIILLKIRLSLLEYMNSEEFKLEFKESKSQNPEETELQFLVKKILSSENFKIERVEASADELCYILDKGEVLESVSSDYWIAKRVIESLIIGRDQILKDLLDIIKQNNGNIYPKFDQRLVLEDLLYQAYDLKNGDGVLNTFNLYITENYLNGRSFIPNTISILGGPGSGKSFILNIALNKIRSILGENKDNFTVLALSNKKVQDLTEDLLGIVDDKKKVEGYTIREFLSNAQVLETCDNIDSICELITTSWNLTEDRKLAENLTIEYNNESKSFAILTKLIIDKKTGDLIKIRYIEVDFSSILGDTIGNIKAWFILQSNEGSPNMEAIPLFVEFNPNIKDKILGSNILIDESTLIHPSLLAFISALANKELRLCIISGDENLELNLVNSGELLSGLSYYKMFYINHTPKLASSYRFTSNLKNDNISTLASIYDEWKKSAKIGIYEDNGVGDELLRKLLELLSTYKLSYQKLDTGEFIGDLVTTSEEDFDKSVRDYILSEEKSGKLIVIIYDPDLSNPNLKEEIKTKFKELGLDSDKNNISIVSIKDILGAEYDYALIYNIKKLGDLDTDYSFNRVYTLLSRARYGTISLDSQDGIYSLVRVSSESLPSTDGYLYSADSTISNTKRLETVNELIKELESITPEQNQNKPEEKELEKSYPGDGSKDYIGGKDVTESQEYPFNGEIDHSTVHHYYIRLGYNWRSMQSLGGLVENLLEINDDLDLIGFIKSHRGENSSYEVYLDKFLKERLELLKDYLKNKDGLECRLYIKQYKPDTDESYLKINEEDTTGGTIVLLLVKKNGYYVTIGRLGVNKVTKNGQTVYKSPFINSLFEEKGAGNEILKEFILSAKSLQDLNHLDIISKYIKERNFKDQNSFNANNVVLLFTGMRGYKLRPELPHNLGLVKDQIILSALFKYGRLSIFDLTKMGYTVSGEDGDFWNPSEKHPWEEFITWYKSYNITKEQIDEDKLKGLLDRMWVVIYKKGSEGMPGYKFPVLINQVLTTNILPLLPLTKTGRLNKYAYNQTLRVLKGFFKEESKEDQANIGYIDTLLKGEKEILLEDKEIENLIKSTTSKIYSKIKSLKESEYEKSTLESIEKIVRQFFDCFKYYKKVPNNDPKFESSNFKNKEDFFKILEETLPGYFMITPLIIQNILGLNLIIGNEDGAKTIVISSFCEEPRSFIFWEKIQDLIQELKEEIPSAVTEAVTSTPKPTLTLAEEKSTPKEKENSTPKNEGESSDLSEDGELKLVLELTGVTKLEEILEKNSESNYEVDAKAAILLFIYICKKFSGTESYIIESDEISKRIRNINDIEPWISGYMLILLKSKNITDISLINQILDKNNWSIDPFAETFTLKSEVWPYLSNTNEDSKTIREFLIKMARLAYRNNNQCK